MTTRVRTLAFALTLVLATRLADASTAPVAPLDALVHDSTLVAFATPMRQMSIWEAGRIFTYTEVRIDDLVAGSLPVESTTWVRTMGGEIGHVGQVTEGEAVLAIGQPMLLFLRPAKVVFAKTAGDGAAVDAPPSGALTVVGRGQGEFAIVAEHDGTTRLHANTKVGALVLPSDAAHVRFAADALHGRTLGEARDVIAEAWGRTHAP